MTKFSDILAIVNEANALGNQAQSLAAVPQGDPRTGQITFTVDGVVTTTNLPQFAIAACVNACRSGKVAQLEALGISLD